MNGKPNARELTQTGGNLGIDTVLLKELESKQYIKKVLEVFKPYKTTGHLSIGAEESLIIPLKGNEFSFSSYLKSEPAYICFDQEGRDKNTVVVINDAKLIGQLMQNSYGMEYFVSNEKADFLIAINWYVIEVAGTAIDSLEKINREEF
ncbi:hypothetical protein ACFQI7_37700 [Paenibacillus allorhizosphaerae]|uniref:Phage major capsid protein n=1 Tax=Paenibacillus allorhizosphaerae TaxID=2849866 RepID=A0ABM8VV88_9BACL|nr:hypothetical protein [Paenibacillus allorhizosphaerae]CAG7659206.1 hypothetical protein PAECIP111802_07474 [Paenibacillus allorhizosphaerae]